MKGYASPIAEAAVQEDSRRCWIAAAAALFVGVVALALVFRPEEAEAVRVWLTSTAYNHCFLVLPVAIYLAWDRWPVAASVPPQPAPWLALAALPLALAWLLAERAGIWEARQLLAMGLLEILFLAVLGPRCWRTLSAPLLYLFFLVPVGGFLVPSLQSFTVHFVKAGLNVLGIPNYVTGVTIEIPEGAFYVAQACAGLRFLIASVAFGALYGCLMYTSPVRRLWFMALSLVAPVIANGFRALGLIVLAHLVGSAAAVETDHILYGWLFFSIVTFALILIGLPFRQNARRPAAVALPGRRGARAALAAAAVVILLAAAPRLLADRIDGLAGHAPVASGLRFPAPPDCGTAPLPAGVAKERSSAGESVETSRAYRCQGGVFIATLRRYPARVSARLLFPSAPAGDAQEAASTAPVLTRTIAVGSGATAQRWTITESERGGLYAATALAFWVDGRPAPGGIRSRLRQAVNALSPGAVSPMVAIVSYTTPQKPGAGRRAIDRFLSGTATLSRQLAASSATDHSLPGSRR